ncbi:MAG: TlpA family protein disulfide reductase [Gammaproteobacteria bacterium]|nr:TlpA family protein disulfide reductase [Gammaproteobacteria bacterium]
METTRPCAAQTAVFNTFGISRLIPKGASLIFLLSIVAILVGSTISANASADILKPLKEAKILQPIKSANLYGRKFDEVNVGTQAPDFTLQSLSEQSVHLAEHRGKVSIITFWASWCGPCRIELPHFEKLRNEIGEDQVAIIAVSADSKRKDIVAFSKELNLNFPLLFDPKLEVNRLYRIRAMPTTFIVDKEGVIRHVHMGFKESVLPLYEKELRALL